MTHAHRALLRTIALGLLAAGIGGGTACAQPPKATAATKDGSHGFDFELGSWKTHVRVLRHPLSGSSTWAEYDGTTLVTPLLGGRANVAELQVRGSAGTIEGLSLRLYEPAAHRWTLNYTNIRDGELTTPVVGSFENGRGTFIGRDALGGRPILVRFVIVPLTPDSIRFEQSFSADDGKTWELNWIAQDARMRR
ncbi:MAG TPA: hypothetical protein VN782_08340 [Usitatibacter sp.]|nr:hypothetical protein [Usitatibacter sp.]